MVTPARSGILDTGLLARMQHLRSTLFRIVIVFLGTSLLAYPFASQLLGLLARPLGMKLVMYAPMEGFLGHITVALATGFCLSAPYFLYTLGRMLRAMGLSPRMTRHCTVAAGALFLIGASFCYFVVLPVTLRFLLSFGGENLDTGIAVSRYLWLTLGLSTTCGFIFELPLVVIVLHTMGLLSREVLTQNRRYAMLASAVLTAILTPTPDAFTMSALLLPLIALYEVSIILVRIAEARQGAVPEE